MADLRHGWEGAVLVSTRARAMRRSNRNALLCCRETTLAGRSRGRWHSATGHRVCSPCFVLGRHWYPLQRTVLFHQWSV